MRVTLLKDISGGVGSFAAGDTVDLPHNMASALVAGGHARAAPEPMRAPAPETAMVAPAPEAAVHRNPAPRRRGRKG